jgi:flagellar biogenesis protein FliO
MDASLPALIVRVVISLGVVLAVTAGAAKVLRRSGVAGVGVGPSAGGRGRGGRRPAPVEIVARRGLSRGASVTVVRLGSRTLVLGVTEHQVSLLTEIDPAELEPPAEDVVATPGVPGTAVGAPPWKDLIEQLRDRTVRRS